MSPKIALMMASIASAAWSGPAHAAWESAHKRNFINECVQSCRAGSNLKDEASKMKCPAYCLCLIEEGEQIFSGAEFIQMDADARVGRTTPAMERFQTKINLCNQQTWGR